MESVGEFFRQVRETKGLSLDDVASKTRIHPDFLRALEEGNFSKLPDQVFAKGFVRSYARSLGLDEEDAMRRFDQSAGTFYDKQSETERLRVKQAEDEKRKKTNRKVVVAAAAVALLGLVLLLTREQSSVSSQRRMVEPQPQRGAPPLTSPREPVRTPEPNAPPLPVPPTTSPVAPPVAPAPAPPPATTERAPSSRPEPAAEAPAPRAPERSESTRLSPQASTRPEGPRTQTPQPQAEISLVPGGGGMAPLLLEMEATDLSWVVVQVDGASPHEALLRPGERVQWKAQDQFTITLGNAGGVRVELNGKPQGPFGPVGKVARDIVLKR
jgi:cytoskeleton protein RodZ